MPKCKANNKKRKQGYFARLLKFLNVSMITRQISTLVEDSSAEKGT